MNGQPAPTPSARETARPGRFCCAACATHKRPDYVPWDQHAIGCTLRQAAIAVAFRDSRTVH